MARFLGIDWVPFNVPLRRRLQTLCVAFHINFTLFSRFILLYIIILTLFSPFWFNIILYSIWFYYDRNAPKRGAHASTWFQKSFLWKMGAEYFPMNLVKTTDLDPNKKYVFGYHPHGIASLGAWYNFATYATGLQRKFPGINIHLCTLAQNFLVPVYRDYILALGLIDASRESIEYVLSDPEPGNSVMIVIGGAQEALDAKPGNYTLTLNRRLGFVRLAIKHGADLVPVFSFGENELFLQVHNPEGSRLRKFQHSFKEKFGFSPALFHGRGIFNYTMGLMPFRKAITAVVGEPIKVPKIENPTDEEVMNIHKEYVQALIDLFEKHKLNYAVPQEVKLTID